MTTANWVYAGVAALAAIGLVATVAWLVIDWRREALAGRHATIPGPDPAAGAAHEDPSPGHGFLPAPTLPPPGPPPLSGIPVPAPREWHECTRDCRLPVPVPVAAFAMLTAAVVTAEMERLEDEARFPWLRSGQYEGETGEFARIDAELARAGS